MPRSFISLTALLSAAFALQTVAAGAAEFSGPASQWQAQAVPTEAPLGYVLAPGVTFLPQLFSEVGYDSNISRTFLDQKNSGFVRSGAGFNLSSVTDRMVTSFGATGSVLDYFRQDLSEPDRLSGNVRGNITYLVQPGLTLTGSGFFDYDGQSWNKNQSGSASLEVGYQNGSLSSFLRGRFLDVQYLNNLEAGIPISPLFLTSAFNYNRSEVSIGGMVTTASRFSPYAELAAARVDYTNQMDPAIINRSADDYYAKGGVRVKFSEQLTGDAGWRWNLRDTDDRFVSSYSSNFFDGSLTWRPSPFLFFTGSIERMIGEPSTSFGILSDIRSYSVKTTYLPVGGVAVSVSGGWQIVTDVGSGTQYHATYADAQVSWDYNSRIQLYTSLHYQTYELEWQRLDYDCLRVMAGVRIFPDGKTSFDGEGLDGLIARLQDSRRPSGAEVSVSAGYSWFGLPDMKMSTVVGAPFFDKSIGQVTNGEGSMNGVRTDVRVGKFAEAILPDGRWLSFGLSGFFANYQGTTTSRCTYGLLTDCAFVNIIDFSGAQENNTGPFGSLNVVASRNVNYYGVAVDAHLGGDWVPAGLKDAGLHEASPFKVGVAMRGIDESAKLLSVDPSIAVPVKYKETVNTHYYGGFVGVEQKENVGAGWTVSVDATAGLYYSDTEYQGRYSGYTTGLPITPVYYQETGTVNNSLDKISFIGTVRVGLDRQFGWGSIGVFGQGEFLGYVPRIAYNNNDMATGAPFGIIGSQIGTRIKSDDAINFTSGVNLKFRVD